MYGVLLCIVIGIIIGWNLKQPKWAKNAQAKVTQKSKELWIWVKQKAVDLFEVYKG